MPTKNASVSRGIGAAPDTAQRSSSNPSLSRSFESTNFVGLRPFRGVLVGQRLVGDQRRGAFRGDRHRPLQCLALVLVRLMGHREFDCGFEFFPYPRNRTPGSRAHVGQCGGDLARIGDHGDLSAEYLLVVQRHRAVGDVR